MVPESDRGAARAATYDLREVSSGDEGTQGPHLPQTAEVEVPKMLARADAVRAAAGGLEVASSRYKTW